MRGESRHGKAGWRAEWGFDITTASKPGRPAERVCLPSFEPAEHPALAGVRCACAGRASVADGPLTTPLQYRSGPCPQGSTLHRHGLPFNRPGRVGMLRMLRPGPVQPGGGQILAKLAFQSWKRGSSAGATEGAVLVRAASRSCKEVGYNGPAIYWAGFLGRLYRTRGRLYRYRHR